MSVGVACEFHICEQTGCSSVCVKFYKGSKLIQEYCYRYDAEGQEITPPEEE